MNFNLTPIQILGIILVVNGALIGSTAQLTDLMGAHTAHLIVSLCSLGNSILGGIVTMFGSQTSQIKAVAAMPGVDSIKVNAQANQALAQVAVDPAQLKVDTAAGASAQVAATAKGE